MITLSVYTNASYKLCARIATHIGERETEKEVQHQNHRPLALLGGTSPEHKRNGQLTKRKHSLSKKYLKMDFFLRDPNPVRI